MKTSKNGINLIKKFEGCRLTAYKCAAGVPTIGYGHTAGVKMGQAITQEQADRYLKDDLVKYEKNVGKYDSKYRWNQNEFDALVSFAFNIGSIDQLTANGTRDRKTIAERILQYNKAAGKVLEGLTKRRKAEQALFLKPITKNLKAAAIESHHAQLNQLAGNKYAVIVDGLRIRTKLSSQNPSVLPDGKIIGTMTKGSKIKNFATARVGEAIWMYIGSDGREREQWVCADTGSKTYIQ